MFGCSVVGGLLVEVSVRKLLLIWMRVLGGNGVLFVLMGLLSMHVLFVDLRLWMDILCELMLSCVCCCETFGLDSMTLYFGVLLSVIILLDSVCDCLVFVFLMTCVRSIVFVVRLWMFGLLMVRMVLVFSVDEFSVFLLMIC